MATATKKKGTKKAQPKKASGNGRKAVTNRMAKTFRADKATFGLDDKRAQYARLVAFNHGVAEKIISKDADVNTVSNSQIEKAGKSLAGGNMLDGKEALELIQKLTTKGSTSGRPLTTAYAAEVRPFLKRLQFSDTFGNRAKGKKKEKAEEAVEAAE
jgi:hypothetical protein